MKISRIRLLSELSVEQIRNGNIDVAVYLEDGRVYCMLVATPNNIYWCMDNEGVDYFIGEPPVLVKELSIVNITTAMEALLEENDGKWLEVYGTLQTSLEDN